MRPIRLRPNQYHSERQRVNWEPDILAKRLPLIACSIGNVVAFLQTWHGKPSEEIEVYSVSEADFLEAMRRLSGKGMDKSRFRNNVDSSAIPVLSTEEIKKQYEDLVLRIKSTA